MKLTPIANGVDGLFIENDRFSTTHISINLYLPLVKENIAVNALLPYVLSSCCADYPDFTALNLKLNQLYGADVGGIAEKSGDVQVLRFFSFCIDDCFTPDDTKVVESAFDLLLSMMFSPSVENNGFKEYDVARERRLTLEKIEGLINEKRSYAINRTISEMYKGEPFGEYKAGSYEAVKAINGKTLYSAWKNVLTNANVRIQVIGKSLPEGLFEKIGEKFNSFGRTPEKILKTKPKKVPESVNRIEEKMDVAQGKLVLGFTTDFTGTDNETAFLSVFADLFGGGPYSKLFANVREKLSLCYYCAARANRTKGYLLVDCGVEFENAKKAEKEILHQLDELRNGNFTDEELKTSIRSIKDSLKGLNDSQSSLDGWYSLKSGETVLSPEEFIEEIEKVKKEDIIKAASLYKLDTVYSIVPNEKEA